MNSNNVLQEELMVNTATFYILYYILHLNVEQEISLAAESAEANQHV